MPQTGDAASPEGSTVRLVIHADDLGMNHGANQAFVELSHFGTIGTIQWREWLHSRPYALTTMRRLRDAQRGSSPELRHTGDASGSGLRPPPRRSVWAGRSTRSLLD